MAGKLSMDGGNSPAVEEAMREVGDISSAAESAEVTIGDPVTPQKDDEPEVGEVGERPSRRERRANRYQEEQEARIRAEERAKVLEEELRAARQQPQPQYQPPPQQQPGPDPLEQATANLRAQHEELVAFYNSRVKAGDLTEEEATKIRERGWKLTEKREELATLRVLHKTGKLAPQPQGLTQQDLINMQLSAQFPEVYADPKLLKRAQLKYDEMTELDGEPHSPATTAKALAFVRDQYGPAQRPAPDQGMKQRLTAVGAGARPGAGGRQQAPTLKMDKDMIKMAVKTYSHLPREQAIQKWANEVGPGFLEDVRGSGR